ncbi:MAG TPA: hypothetical protein VKR60_10975 [Candidatus Sulfotelmatobacter sp.]|nr:hypothetical protein [Candidatus Sulfotelmatobacter sp.]
MPDTAAFCPGCGRSVQAAPRAHGEVGILPENVAGALSYFTFIPATFFLAVSSYNRNRFVRFHSLQCLLFTLACLLIGIAIKLASLILFFVPVLGPLLVSLISIVAILAAIVLWLVLVVKAFQGEMFMLPVLGNFAEQQAKVIPG